MTALIRALLVLGAVSQALMAYAAWGLLTDNGRSPIAGITLEIVTIALSPSIVAGGGATLARALRRRGSRLAWPAAVVPFAVLLLALGIALNFYFDPPPMHGGSGRLPL